VVSPTAVRRRDSSGPSGLALTTRKMRITTPAIAINKTKKLNGLPVEITAALPGHELSLIAVHSMLDPRLLVPPELEGKRSPLRIRDGRCRISGVLVHSLDGLRHDGHRLGKRSRRLDSPRSEIDPTLRWKCLCFGHQIRGRKFEYLEKCF
jgi:hypothetical protein